MFLSVSVSMTASVAFAQAVYTPLEDFSGSNGSDPECVLTEIRPGVFLGSTSISSQADAGTLFGVTSSGSFLSLIALNPQTQGALPVGMLFPASDGNYYGITQGGGPGGTGTLFSASKASGLSVLTSNVVSPSQVIQGFDQNLYFTSYTTGGILSIVRTSSAGGLITLYTFPSASYTQAGPLVQGTDGNFYGETGGLAPNYGTIYQITPAGAFTTLYTFQGGTDGAQPLGGLLQATNGLLYGVTNTGGAAGQNIGLGNGVIFSITTSGQFTALYNFNGATDGANPLSSLYQASDGNLYGTNGGPGAVGPGTVFRIGLNGSNFATAFTFPSAFPQVPGPGVIQASDGLFYGATLQGGPNGQGEIFKLDLGLNPPLPAVKGFVPASGSAGTTVIITGRDFTGTSFVTFTGTPATFKQAGPFYLSTTVPSGASSGPITVTTANGSTQSSGIFLVQ